MKKYAFILLCAAFAAAQEGVNYASVSGRVTDASGAVIGGATLTARQTETQSLRLRPQPTRKGKDASGSRFSSSGTVRNQGPSGMASPTPYAAVTLTVGAAFELPVTLTVGPMRADIVVIGDAPLLETARSQIAGTISQTEVASVPLNGRNFLDLALLVPGVSPTNTASNQLFAETSAVPGQGISVGSQRNFSNNFIVDGLSANDDAAGLSGIFYGLDVVREFQVVTSGGQAELGRALGGYVNMVTKSGTNTLHGDLYGYFRNQRFNAANPLSNTKLPSTQAQYGASLGGPIVADRTFYFTNFERRDLNQSGLITIAPSAVTAIDARLAVVGYKGAPIFTGALSQPGAQLELPRENRSSVHWHGSNQRPLQLVRRHERELARGGRIERGECICRARQHRSDAGGEQRGHALAAHRQRNARAVYAQLAGRTGERPVRSCREHFRSRVVWYALRLAYRTHQ